MMNLQPDEQRPFTYSFTAAILALPVSVYMPCKTIPFAIGEASSPSSSRSLNPALNGFSAVSLSGGSCTRVRRLGGSSCSTSTCQ